MSSVFVLEKRLDGSWGAFGSGMCTPGGLRCSLGSCRGIQGGLLEGLRFCRGTPGGLWYAFDVAKAVNSLA